MSPLRRLLGYFAPHRGRLALLLVVIALQSAVPGAVVLLVQEVLDSVLVARDARALALLPFAVVGLYAANGALGFARGMLAESVAWAVITRLRTEIFASFLRQEVAWHQRKPVGELLARLTNDVYNVQYGVEGIVAAVHKPLSLAILVGVAFAMDPTLALVAVAALPLIALPIHRLGRWLRRASRATLDDLARLTAMATEAMSGIRVVQAFGAEAAVAAVFARQADAQRRLKLREFATRMASGPVVELIAAIGAGAVIWFGGRQVFAGEVAPGELIAFMVALGLLNEPLKGIAQVHAQGQRALAAADTLFGLLDREPAIADSGTAVLDADRVALRFEGVRFDYGEGEVLRGLDFDVPAGQVVAIVGASGAGKTTIAGLVPRFHDPTGGRVLLNGRDLREYTLSSLRGHVALVSQETFLFDDTVAANIAFGSPGATPAAIEAAARAANAHEFVEALPDGYQSRVHELGMRLSGGQRQRIAIARAVLRDAPLLVLDEATSALDAESEAAVQEAIERLVRHRTVIAIAHRLTTVRGADRIVVLEGGVVAENGTHADLVARGGVYARIVAGGE